MLACGGGSEIVISKVGKQSRMVMSGWVSDRYVFSSSAVAYAIPVTRVVLRLYLLQLGLLLPSIEAIVGFICSLFYYCLVISFFMLRHFPAIHLSSRERSISWEAIGTSRRGQK